MEMVGTTPLLFTFVLFDISTNRSIFSISARMGLYFSCPPHFSACVSMSQITVVDTTWVARKTFILWNEVRVGK